MSRFVQPGPDLPDPYTGDPLLRGWLDRTLGDAGHAAAAGTLTALAADVLGPLRAAHRDAEAHPPVLTRYDPWGARIDRVDTAPGWDTLRRAAATYGLVGLPYDLAAHATWPGGGARVVQHALLHLYGPESATFSCPVAMSDGAVALLTRPDAGPDAIDPGVVADWLPRLTATDPDTAVTSGQWMTEARGGSDLSGTATTATRDGAGTWRLTGEKWFCSAVDAAVAVALARPDGAGPGSRTLAPFLVPRYADVPRYAGDGVRPAPGVTVHRLKDKLGTRALPTAEVGLRDAAAVPLGDPHTPGLARMMTLVVVTRLHNAAAAAAGMRRGLAYARAYAAERAVAGGRLLDRPLHRATLGVLAVDTAGAFALAAHAFALLGEAESGGVESGRAGGVDAAAALRLVAPVAKLTTGRLAVAAASELVECFGGAGYVEDTGVPRLLRDAQVLPIWEGTTNVLALDVLRALGSGAVPDLDAACDALAAGPLPRAADALHAARSRLRHEVKAAAADPRAGAVQAGARGLALRLGHVLAAGQLAGHAGWASVRGDGQPGALAALWTLRHCAGADIAADAHRLLD